jgi:hypothetical protein
VEAVEFVVGFVLVWAVLNDVFSAVILPRPTPSRFRPAAMLVRTTWRLWRDRYVGEARADRRERRLGVYAPAVVIALLFLWIAMLVAGFGLMLYALRDQVEPSPDLGSAFYFAATSILTIGFGDFVATAWPARTVAIVGGIAGLGVVALGITYLFSLYGSFQRREVLVVTLDERAGAPPSGVTLLETYARLGIGKDLDVLFGRWESWCAEVLESHVAYPILAFFRSTHDNESWVSALGAVLDASVLLQTTIDAGPQGQAHLTGGLGAHLVEDMTAFLRLPSDGDCGVERAEFDSARDRLSAVGYTLRPAEESWQEFATMRERYASRLNSLARFLAVPPTLWIGDRSPLRHTTGR